jgi:hypothetical protein
MLTIALLICSLLWRLHGGLTLACLMWVLLFRYLRNLPPRLKDLPVPWFSVLIGMFCNAMVTIANGGFMPVVGLRQGFRPLLRTWVSQVPGHHLTILADQASLNYCSIGDVLVISGVVVWCIGPYLLAQMRRLAVAQANGRLAVTKVI